jgi:endonuclease/exonuclease/phosphatase family metal-dependent hydrolase
MKDVLTGNFAAWRCRLWPPQTIRVVNWNIDRGLRLPEITDFLESQQADLLTLQEVDLNARRTHFLNVAEELARKLEMNYVFGREFEELTQESRTAPAYHGQATLSRWPLKSPRVIRFQSQSGFWRPRWFLPKTAPFQERLGGRIALVTDLDVTGETVRVYNLHLESRGDDKLRLSQLTEVLDDAAAVAPRVPVLLAGDLNFDISEGPAAPRIRQADFRNALGSSRLYTRPAHSLLGNPRSIDWALVRGALEATEGQLHERLNASDHYPITFMLRFS